MIEPAQSPAMVRENCKAPGPKAQYLLPYPIQHTAGTLPAHSGEQGSSQFPAATPILIIFHLGSSTVDEPQRCFRNFKKNKCTPSLPCLWGLLCVFQAADLFPSVKPLQRGLVSLLCISASLYSGLKSLLSLWF